MIRILNMYDFDDFDGSVVSDVNGYQTLVSSDKTRIWLDVDRSKLNEDDYNDPGTYQYHFPYFDKLTVDEQNILINLFREQCSFLYGYLRFYADDTYINVDEMLLRTKYILNHKSNNNLIKIILFICNSKIDTFLSCEIFDELLLNIHIDDLEDFYNIEGVISPDYEYYMSDSDFKNSKLYIDKQYFYKWMSNEDYSLTFGDVKRGTFAPSHKVHYLNYSDPDMIDSFYDSYIDYLYKDLSNIQAKVDFKKIDKAVYNNDYDGDFDPTLEDRYFDARALKIQESFKDLDNTSLIQFLVFMRLSNIENYDNDSFTEPLFFFPMLSDFFNDDSYMRECVEAFDNSRIDELITIADFHTNRFNSVDNCKFVVMFFLLKSNMELFKEIMVFLSNSKEDTTVPFINFVNRSFWEIIIDYGKQEHFLPFSMFWNLSNMND